MIAHNTKCAGCGERGPGVHWHGFNRAGQQQRYCTMQCCPDHRTVSEDEAERIAAEIREEREEVKKEQAEGPECMCDCGDRTAGGRFLPGHDSKLKSRLAKQAKGGDDAARDRMIELGWEKYLG